MRTIPSPLAPSALEHPGLAMPSDDLEPGPARDVRRAMARFRDGSAHAHARAGVERLLEDVDPAVITTIAARRTVTLRAQGRRDLAAAVVPAATMAEAIDVLSPHDDGRALVEALHTLGDTIVTGVGETAAADAAAVELSARLGEGPEGVARLSVLHQARGATGALVELLLTTGDDRPPAVAATKRTAAHDIALPGFGTVAAGETVAVALDRPTEFGHGPHACPGRDLALSIAAAIVEALDA